MALSTSSSSAWAATWLTAATLLVATLGLYESRLAGAGYLPSVAMNEDLWAWHRMRADSAERPVVLLGASRMLLNTSMPTLRAHYARREVLMLALNGRYPLAALEQLAKDVSFSGTAIVSLNAQALEPWSWEMQADYTRYFEEKSSLYRSFDALLGSKLQSVLRFANTDLSLLELMRYFDAHGQFRPRSHTSRATDLSIRADFSESDHGTWQRHFHEVKVADLAQNPPSTLKDWQQQVERLHRLVTTIQARGGEVILVRMPTSHELWQVEEQHYPRAQYWDYLAAYSGARSIHFQDFPAMAKLYLPDASHLDYRDRKAFTRALLEAIETTRNSAHE